MLNQSNCLHASGCLDRSIEVAKPREGECAVPVQGQQVLSSSGHAMTPDVAGFSASEKQLKRCFKCASSICRGAGIKIIYIGCTQASEIMGQDVDQFKSSSHLGNQACKTS